MIQPFNNKSNLQHLSAEEITNPGLVLQSFFENYSLSRAKKHIASWMAYINKSKSWKKYSADYLIYFYEHQLKLFEAAWLFHQMDNTGNPAILSFPDKPQENQLMDVNFYCKSSELEFSWQSFPRSLNKKEFINPYKVFFKLFKFRTLPSWKKELNNALHASLTNTNPSKEDIMDVINIKKHLDKVADASHLIFVRNAKRPTL